jgi:hypothetical protein
VVVCNLHATVELEVCHVCGGVTNNLSPSSSYSRGRQSRRGEGPGCNLQLACDRVELESWRLRCVMCVWRREQRDQPKALRRRLHVRTAGQELW